MILPFSQFLPESASITNNFLIWLKQMDAFMMDRFNLRILYELSDRKGEVRFDLMVDDEAHSFLYDNSNFTTHKRSRKRNKEEFTWKQLMEEAYEKGSFAVGIQPGTQQSAYEHALGFFMIRFDDSFVDPAPHIFSASMYTCDRTERHYADTQDQRKAYGEDMYLALYAKSDYDRDPAKKSAQSLAVKLSEALKDMPKFDKKMERGEMLARDLGLDFRKANENNLTKSMKTFTEFVSESQKVKTDPEVKEYSLKHIEGSQFEISSPNFNKTFSVEPYKKETVEKIRVVFHQLLEALDNTDVNELLLRITKAERIDYEYGKVFNEKFSIAKIPDLLNGMTETDLSALKTSERDFLLNQFSSLSRAKKDLVTKELRERAEVLCCVIEALFFFLRKIDKENFYAGLAKEEILDLYETEIERCSNKIGFTVKGPFQSVTSEAEIGENDSTAFWRVEYPSGVKFFIRATIAPKELYAEENISKTQGLKFSLITEKDLNPEKPFDFFNIGDLKNKMGEFLKKLKNDAKR